MKKNLAVFLGGIALFVIVAVFGPRENDPAYRPHPATYYGRPAFAQLHRPQNGYQSITFYRAWNAEPEADPISESRDWKMGEPIITVPTELALEMYHARNGY